MAKKKPLVIFKGDTTITHLGEKQKRRELPRQANGHLLQLSLLSPKSAISQQCCSHGGTAVARAENQNVKKNPNSDEVAVAFGLYRVGSKLGGTLR